MFYLNIYNSTETDFDHNETALTKIVSAKIREELNGVFTLTLECLLSDVNAAAIVRGAIIKCPVPGERDDQLFRITATSRTLKTIVANCSCIGIADLSTNFIANMSIAAKTRIQATKLILNNAMENHRFTAVEVGAADTAVENLKIVRYNPINAIFGDDDNTMINRYGGEYQFDNFQLRVAKQLGNDNGLRIIHGKNITGITETIDDTDLATVIVPQAADEVLLPEYYIESPNVDKYEKRYFKHVIFSDLQVNDDNTEAAIQRQMRELVNELFVTQKVDQLFFNYTVNFIELRKTVEYKDYAVLETIGIGDTVTIYSEKLNLDLEGRLYAYTYDVLGDRYDELEIGAAKPNICDTLNSTKKSISLTEQKIEMGVSSLDEKLSSKIEVTSTKITAQVNDVNQKLSSKIEATAKEINASVTDNVKNLSASITVNANAIKTKVGSDDVKTIITQSPTQVKTAFNNGSDYVSLTANGLKTVHSDGSYSMLGKDGIKHYNGSSGNTYHYLMSTGSAAVGGNLSSTVTITLPAEFKGKDFTVTLSVKSTRYTPQVYGDAISGIYLNLESVDKAKGTFKVKGEWTSYSIQTTIQANRELEFTYIAIA